MRAQRQPEGFGQLERQALGHGGHERRGLQDSEIQPGLEVSSWLGIAGPPGMAPEVQRRLVKSVEHATRQPRFVQTVERRGSETAPGGGDAFTAHLATERERLERTVPRTGLRLD